MKIGSSSVTRNSGPDQSILLRAVEQSFEAQARGWKVILVTSGAKSVGLSILSEDDGATIPGKVAAAYGQPVLMEIYRQLADRQNGKVCQVLVGESDLKSSERMEAISKVVLGALDLGIVPIVNGNDPADSEKSNNDLVAAGISVMAGATHLLLLTDVSGVYQSQVGVGPPLPEIHVDEIHLVKSGAGGSGTGGIRSKLRAAEIASRNGIDTRIASAREDNAISLLIGGGQVGTLIHAAGVQRRSGSRRWIAGGAVSQGSITINAEAEDSISAGSSLFASGVKRIKGLFGSGDVVEIVSPQGKLLGRGSVALSSQLLNLIRALTVEDIATVMVYVLSSGYHREHLRSTGSSAGRARLTAAFRVFETYGGELQRNIKREVLTLFPDDSAVVVSGEVARTTNDVIKHYLGLVGSLAVIPNKDLVEYHTRTVS